MRDPCENISSEISQVNKAKEAFGNVFLSFAIAIFIFGVLIRVVVIVGASMEPTLTNKDIVIVWMAGYSPKRGDIIVAKINDKYIVKRVIGLDGDTIQIDYENSIVYRNGLPLDEPYTNGPMLRPAGSNAFETYVVGPNEVFVLGDNRNHSSDSRSATVGFIDENNVLGKVFYRVFSLGSG